VIHCPSGSHALLPWFLLVASGRERGREQVFLNLRPLLMGC